MPLYFDDVPVGFSAVITARTMLPGKKIYRPHWWISGPHSSLQQQSWVVG